ncbi:hydrogenase nickel incorporation protein [archaeon BMS3Bbin16]|nr:hydrogenase nickel incorporation protein [archaeon BMS3Bbin16]
MHGMPAAKEIVEAAQGAAEKEGRTVKSIEVEMGPDSRLDAEELKLCFDVASQDTALEDTKLKITLKPGLVECLDCGKSEEKTMVDRIPICPACYSPNLKINGIGIVIKDIELK